MSHWRWLIVWLCASAAAAEEWSSTSTNDLPEVTAARPASSSGQGPAIHSPTPLPPADSAAETSRDSQGTPSQGTIAPTPPDPTTSPPGATPAAPEIIFDDVAHEWSNDILAGEALIWRELRSSLEILPGDGDTFGLTTIGFGSLAVANGSLSASQVTAEKGPQVWFAPRFGWHFLSGPRTPDLPPQLYTLNLEFGFAAPVDTDTTAHLLITPTWTTDFHTSGGEAFRVIAGGLVTRRVSSDWLLGAGAMYLDRPDLPVLPLGGVRWSPGDNFELDLMIPRPRASFRLRREPDSRDESWLYVGGDLGGGSWAFERPGGFDDRVGYIDLRLVGGIEWRGGDGTRAAFEAGYVFDRRLEFDRGPGDQDLPGTAVIRMGANY